MLVSVSHPMSISPVIEYVAPASAVTNTELSLSLSSDPVRGARTCRHPCSAFSSNRIRGTFRDQLRGARTCCLLCRTSDSD